MTGEKLHLYLCQRKAKVISVFVFLQDEQIVLYVRKGNNRKCILVSQIIDVAKADYPVNFFCWIMQDLFETGYL